VKNARHDLARFQNLCTTVSDTVAASKTGRTGVRAVHLDHDRFLETGAVSQRVRGLVAESWRRSAAAGVDVDTAAPLVVDSSALVDYRSAHPLSRVFPLLYDVLGRAAEECDSLMAVGDAQGRLLWVAGRPGVLRKAERINFVEGAAWDEAHAGTNAPGTALRLDAAVQIRAAEHFSRSVQRWTCVAAPIHDPATHAVLGFVDVTGGDDIASPQTMGMVRAAARMAEAELGRLLALMPPDRLWVPFRESAVTMDALGRADCQLSYDGRTVRLSPRHSEIVVLLVDHPEGLTGDQLAIAVYPEDVRTSTMRAELTRLRSLLGADLLDSRPYRLRREITGDWCTVEAHLSAGRVADAMRFYRGPLLPQSDAPGVVDRRERLERQMRAAVLASADVDLIVAWTRSRWGADDIDAWAQQARLLPPGSPLGPAAAAEVAWLNRELGLSQVPGRGAPRAV
jgi:hypothetical protein